MGRRSSLLLCAALLLAAGPAYATPDPPGHLGAIAFKSGGTLQAVASYLNAGTGLSLSCSAGVCTIISTGGGGASSGTISAPGIYFSAQPGMGLYRKSAGVLGVSTDGTNALKVYYDSLNTGDVAIWSDTAGVGVSFTDGSNVLGIGQSGIVKMYHGSFGLDVPDNTGPRFTGEFYPSSDNAQDIGDDTHRVRTLKAGTSLITPTVGTASGTQHALPSGTGALLQSGSTAGGDLSGTLPSPTVAQINGSPLGTITSATPGQALTWNGSAWVPLLITKSVYGDGSDGTCTFDGSATPAGTTKNSSTSYTLARSIWCTNATVSAGVDVNTAAFVMSGTGSLTIASTGVVEYNGLPASGATAGAQVLVVYCGGGTAGGSGTTTTCATGGAQTVTYSAAGGAGGAGGVAGVNAGCAGGTVTVPTTAVPTPHRAYELVNCGSRNVIYRGGAGGGSGGGDGTSAGGGGGGGGGTLSLAFPTITNSGSITATGGAGANGVGGAAGGGGGGSGGLVLTVSASFTGNVPTAAGGTKGLKAGGSGSVDGANGGAGVVIQITN